MSLPVIRHSRPNILLIMTDQHRLSGVGCYGPTPCLTPNIDRLAGEGVRFEQAYTTCPVCSPARASIMTGQFPHAHRFTSNAANLGCSTDALADGPALLSRRLQAAGYRLGYTGKWHLCGERRPNQPEPFGLPRDYGFEGQNFPGHGNGGHGFKEYQDYLRERGLEFRRPRWDEPTPMLLPAGRVDGPPESTESYFLADHTISLIERFASGDDPFFIWHNFWGPHSPYYVTQDFYDLYRSTEIPPWPNYAFPARRIAGPHQLKIHPLQDSLRWQDWQVMLRYYYAFVSMIDEQVGRMVGHLERRGLLDDTLIVFMADHGETLGSHGGLADKGWSHFEEIQRIPLICRPPGGTRPRVVRTPVSLADIYPTLCELAERGSRNPACPEGIHGRSLLASIEAAVEPTPTAIGVEFGGVNQLAATLRTVRLGSLKYGFNCIGKDELYDLESDPHEVRNLIDHPAYAQAAARMRWALFDWMERTQDPARPMIRTSRQHLPIEAPQPEDSRNTAPTSA